jgi:hypothetical protein
MPQLGKGFQSSLAEADVLRMGTRQNVWLVEVRKTRKIGLSVAIRCPATGCGMISVN